MKIMFFVNDFFAFYLPFDFRSGQDFWSFEFVSDFGPVLLALPAMSVVEPSIVEVSGVEAFRYSDLAIVFYALLVTCKQGPDSPCDGTRWHATAAKR